MRASIIFSALAATASAAPLALRYAWAPLPGTKATCGDREKYMSLVIGPENAQSILKHSCAAFMPPCAYPAENNLDPNTVCTAVDTYPLDGPKNVTLPVLVESGGHKLSKWGVNFFVVPKTQEGGIPVQWTAEDCEGYINELVSQTDPNGCMIPGTGPGAGNLTVGAPTDGTTNSLTGTIVGAKFVEK
ncbi:hypothetical protein CC80DRAFT_160405 [Byssothecium circinans]|uniref:Uncharacterized protein n=1 Tax=Byssothecium circinans TaxID=147558 RepID=A0A6A5UHJ3_9PLEO|nr:hypothetical protein CC80DRAFT_160405 [Byssothecium circinans]